MNISQKKIYQFQKHILNWYAENKRDLPWRQLPFDTRLQQRDPYKILVSEIMLQQTQVQRVISKYEVWLTRFPDIPSLAEASTAEVLKYWSGLGYNRRALYLQKLARKLVEGSPRELASLKLRKAVGAKRKEEKITNFPLHLGERQDEISWPRTEGELVKLPGIGKYTARALLCFAFNQQVAVVDTNIRKVILTQLQSLCHCEEHSDECKLLDESRYQTVPDEAISSLADRTMGLLHPSINSGLAMTLKDRDIENIAEQLLPHGKAYEWNQALMDYSSAMLKDQKIPIPKQSRFKDSDRYYRGEIIRLLIKNQKSSFDELQKNFSKDGMSSKRLEKIIEGLEKDGLVIKKNERFALP